MGDAKQFQLDLKKFGNGTQKTLSALVRRASLLVMGDLIKGSPVDTGRFQASWFVGVGAPNRTVGRARAKESGAKEESRSRLKELTPETVSGYQPVFISNNLAYGPSLANGSSGQAASGWIDAAVLRAEREINAVKVIE